LSASEMPAGAPPPAKYQNAQRTFKATVFDSSDGVRNVAAIGSYTPHVAKSRDGRIWSTTVDGLSVVDPRRLPFNKIPPPVSIEQITADRKIYPAHGYVQLPPRVRDLQIDYTALS